MAKKKTTAAVDLSHIVEGLRPLAGPIGELVPDPTNARKHGEKNLAVIMGSLRQYGQRTPLVVQREGMIVRKGNGTLAAAIQLGWTQIAYVLVDDDNVSAVGYAIADNRAAELAQWDKDVLEQMLRVVEVGDEDLQQMCDDLAKDLDIVIAEADAGGSEPPAAVPPTRESYQVLITCDTEDVQKELLDRLTKEGLQCRALIVPV